MSKYQQNLAFFGATGGCAGNTLAMALKSGHRVSALARTPQKLYDMLEKEHEIPRSLLDKNLQVIQGSVDEIAAVKEVLAPAGVPASLIVTGVGGTPKLSGSLKSPFTMDQPNICATTSSTILEALRELRRSGVIDELSRPTICVISTTGIGETQDVPCMVKGLYRTTMFKLPHADKEIQEHNIAVASNETGPDSPISGFVFVRPTLLMDGPAKGLQEVRAGWVKHGDALNAVAGDAPGPALGYGIRRADVGNWIFENVVKNTGHWEGKCVTLTY